MRFCSRCGFPMEGAMQVLAYGGMLPPQYQTPAGEKTISPRRKGVKQGALLFLSGILVVSLLGILASFLPGGIGTAFEFFTAASAILCFVGGPLRMLYAAIFEEGAPTRQFVAPHSQQYPHSYAPPVTAPQPVRVSALPPQAVNTAASWRQRPQTAEIMQPPSVTDHTTRLLDKSEPEAE